MTDSLDLRGLLEFFNSQDIADALMRGGGLSAGTKDERTRRLIALGHAAGDQPAELLDLFSSESLRRVASGFGIRDTRKADLITALCALVPAVLPDPLPPPAELRPATRDDVVAVLQNLTLTHRHVRDEKDAEIEIASLLEATYQAVSTQFRVGGYLGHKIDIDLGDGKVGVEVKLAASVLTQSSEAYRLIGQAVYYDRRRYSGNLIVAIVGPAEDRNNPAYSELAGILTAMRIATVFVGA